MRALFLTMICIAALAVPATAAAQGNAGGDQYTENVPTADGQTPSADIDSGSEDPAPDGSSEPAAPAPAPEPAALSEDTTAELGDKGADGDAVARLSEAGAPDREEASKADTAASGKANIDDEKAVKAASSSGPSGLGVGLPIFLILSLLVAVALRFARRGETS
jgi:hypothetical protein